MLSSLVQGTEAKVLFAHASRQAGLQEQEEVQEEVLTLPFSSKRQAPALRTGEPLRQRLWTPEPQ